MTKAQPAANPPCANCGQPIAPDFWNRTWRHTNGKEDCTR